MKNTLDSTTITFATVGLTNTDIEVAFTLSNTLHDLPSNSLLLLNLPFETFVHNESIVQNCTMYIDNVTGTYDARTTWKYHSRLNLATSDDAISGTIVYTNIQHGRTSGGHVDFEYIYYIVNRDNTRNHIVLRFALLSQNSLLGSRFLIYALLPLPIRMHDKVRIVCPSHRTNIYGSPPGLGYVALYPPLPAPLNPDQISGSLSAVRYTNLTLPLFAIAASVKAISYVSAYMRRYDPFGDLFAYAAVPVAGIASYTPADTHLYTSSAIRYLRHMCMYFYLLFSFFT
uniref:Forkhead box protein O1 n=1 Tax=Lygus hesperus TaxID=30085 RepID=A0A0A9VY89_LYGHE